MPASLLIRQLGLAGAHVGHFVEGYRTIMNLRSVGSPGGAAVGHGRWWFGGRPEVGKGSGALRRVPGKTCLHICLAYMPPWLGTKNAGLGNSPTAGRSPNSCHRPACEMFITLYVLAWAETPLRKTRYLRGLGGGK